MKEWKEKNAIVGNRDLPKGLGPNIGSNEWEEKIAHKHKMMEYSDIVKKEVKLPVSDKRKPKRDDNKAESCYDKRKEYSKNVPKPKDGKDNNPNEIHELEREHEEMKQKLERIRNLIN